MRHPSARETLPQVHRCGYRCGPVTVPKSAQHSVEFAAESSDIRVWDHSRIHKDTPALPFCHFAIKAKKPRNSDYPTTLTTLGDHLRAKRLDLRLTQKQLAKQLRLEKTTINNWETNRSVPVIRLVPRIIEFLGYTPYRSPKALAQRLLMRRRLLGLSQKRLAKQLCVDESSICSWESGRRIPNSRCRRILEIFCKEL
jgi:transcriptional regulator with XRE-family HTH domain